MTQQQQQPNCHRPPQTASAAVQGSSGASKAPSQHPAVQKQPVATPGTLAERAATTNATKTQAPTKGTLAASASASNISHQSAMQLKQSTLQKSQSATQVRRYFSGFLPRVFFTSTFFCVFTLRRYVLRFQVKQQPPSMRTVPDQPDWSVQDSLDFIEGNSKSSVNEKKKAKKERQRLQRLEEQQKQEEEERRKKQAEERERKRREEEEKKRQELEYQLQKKKAKKDKQRAKKLAAKGGAAPEPDSPEPEPEQSPPPPPPIKSKPGTSTATTLEELKAQHQRELMKLQLEHQKALQEQERKLLEQQQLQQQQLFAKQQQGKIQAGKKGKGSKASTPASSSGGTKQATRSSQQSLRQPPPPQQQQQQAPRPPTAPMSSIMASASKTLSEASKKPGQQIKITRTPTGGVEFTTVPVDVQVNQQQPAPTPPPATNSQAHLFASASAQPPAASLMGGGQQNPYLRDMLNSNPSFGGGHGAAAAAGPPPPPPTATTPRPSVPSQSNQPMVTIRRVENPSLSQPTVTISMKSDGQLLSGGGGATASGKGTEDKLLYTLVDGEILKAKDAPDNLIPSAKPMPKNMVFNRTVGKPPGAVQPPTRSSFTATGATGPGSSSKAPAAPAGLGTGRPPLPLDPQVRTKFPRALFYVCCNYIIRSI